LNPDTQKPFQKNIVTIWEHYANGNAVETAFLPGLLHPRNNISPVVDTPEQ
jgi:hypothetical protein